MAERIDIRDKVTGRARYVEDLPEPPATLFAAAIRSPYSHARIGAIDASSAEALSGVAAILHRDSLDAFDVQLEAAADVLFATPTDNPFITQHKARYDGDLLGMVAATDLRTARAAAAAVQIDYEPLPPIFSAKEALAPGAPLIHEELGTNLALTESLEWGDVDRALAEAAHVFEGSFTSPTIFHHPMEPAMSALVHFHDDMLDVWAPTNNPFDIVEAASRLFGLDHEQVRVRVPAVGGNFGAKHLAAEVLLAAALSRKLNRPVKYVATEEESFRVTARHAMTYSAKVGLAADGAFLALDVDLEVDTGAYFTGARIATQNAVNSAWGGYRLPNFRAQARTAYTNKVPAAMFRNTGKNQITFAIDCLMDSIARSRGVGPVEFRLQNLLRRGERPPVETWRRNGREAPAEFPPLDTDFSQLVQLALDGIGWDGHAASPSLPSPSPALSTVEGTGAGQGGAETPESSPYARGRGIATFLRRGSSIGSATARARLDTDGIVTIEHNAPDVGEGAHTVISLVAAGTLGVAQDRVRVAEPDTSNQLRFSGTSSQRTTVQMGTAVRMACEGLKEQLQQLAAEAFGGASEEWRIESGYASRGDQRVPLGQLASRAPRAVLPSPLAGEGGGEGSDPDFGMVEATGTYDRGAVRDTSFGSHDHWSPGVAAAEVEVNRDTGEVRVLRYAAVADAGTVLHYPSARGQIEGGAVMGFGAALTEEIFYAEGQLLNADAFQYRLPRMGDIPEAFEIAFVEHSDGPGPFGSKGIAQTSIPCPAPAIGNAICDALGVRLTSTPFTPEKVLRAMGALPE